MDKYEIHQLQWKDLYYCRASMNATNVTKEWWQNMTKCQWNSPPLKLWCFVSAINQEGVGCLYYHRPPKKAKILSQFNSTHISLTDKTNPPGWDHLPFQTASTWSSSTTRAPGKTCRPEAPPWRGCFWRLGGFLFGGLFVLPIGSMGRWVDCTTGTNPLRGKNNENAMGSGKVEV